MRKYVVYALIGVGVYFAWRKWGSNVTGAVGKLAG